VIQRELSNKYTPQNPNSFKIIEYPPLVQARVLPKVLPISIPRMARTLIHLRQETIQVAQVCQVLRRRIRRTCSLDHIGHSAQEDGVASGEMSVAGGALVEGTRGEIDQLEEERGSRCDIVRPGGNLRGRDCLKLV